MHRLHLWFNEERAYKHEVRGNTINTRLKFEQVYERDKQLVLRDHKSKEFAPWALEATQKRLETFQITNASKTQEKRFFKVVCLRIGAPARTGHIQLVGRGDVED